jgi:hypothetical protein
MVSGKMIITILIIMRPTHPTFYTTTHLG